MHRVVLASLMAVAGLGGCGPPPPLPSAAATTAQDTSKADARLRGNWRLEGYRPDVPLEPMFQLLLTQQMQTMVVHFEGGHLRGDSPTLHVDRAYRLSYAAGPYFKLESPDASGATITSTATMADDGSRIAFHTETDPWKGSGTLVRLP